MSSATPATTIWSRLDLRRASFRTQISVSTMALMTLVVLAVAVALQVLLAFIAQREVNAVLASHTQEVMSSVNAASASRRLRVDPHALDLGEMIFDASARPVAGRVQRPALATAQSLARSQQVTNVAAGSNLRLRATPFTTDSGASGVIVVSQDTAAYESSEHLAFVAVLILGFIAVGATGLLARGVTKQALLPVRQMAITAAAWSEVDLQRRFDLGTDSNEITALGATLDQLLERVARAIRSEQRLSGEMAHELRTPLTVIRGSAELALMRPGLDDATRNDLTEIVTAATSMSAAITTLLQLARDLDDAKEGTCLTSEVLQQARLLLPAQIFAEMRAPHQDWRLSAPLTLVVRSLAPILDNSARYARSRVDITVTKQDAAVEIVVRDDGPGFSTDMAGRAFEPGASTSGGTGLGMSISRRVARTVGGDVTVSGQGVILSFPTV